MCVYQWNIRFLSLKLPLYRERPLTLSMVPDDNQDLYLSVWVVTESEVAARCVSVQCDSTTTVLEFIRKLAKALEVRYIQCVLYKVCHSNIIYTEFED